MQVIEMTHSEKVEMYQMVKKDKLIEMLIEANNVINRLTEVKNLRIADVSGSLPTVHELKAKSYELYPRVAGDASESYRNSVQRNNWIQGAQYVRKLVGNDR